jgi:hypothetical protein
MISPLPHTGDVVDGVVAKANERGVLLAGEDVWVNVSKYADPRPNLPRPGERVRLHIDGQGYIRAVDVLPVEDGADPEPDDAVPARQVEPTTPPSRAVSPDKDVRITRMNALTTATAILSSGGRDCDTVDVLRLAAHLERWVNHSC